MAFKSRDLDVSFRLYHLTEVDLDVVVDVHEPPTIDYDTAIVAAYGVEDEGSIDEFAAIRVTKPAEKGDTVVFLPPSNEHEDRHSKQRIIGESDEESSTDIYRGDIEIMPGDAVGGISKKLMLKSQSGLSSLTVPDTPIPNFPPNVYDANEFFELEGKVPGANMNMEWDEFRNHWLVDRAKLVTFNPLRYDSWMVEKQGVFELLFDPNQVHINNITVTSESLRLGKTVIKGHLPYPYESGKFLIDINWTFGTSLEEEIKSRNSSITITMELWDLRLGSIIKYDEVIEIGFGNGYFDVIYPLLINSLIPISGVGSISGPTGRALVGTGADEYVEPLHGLRITGVRVCSSALKSLGSYHIAGDTDEIVNLLMNRIYSVVGTTSLRQAETQKEERSTDINLPVHFQISNLSNEFTNLVSW